MYIFNFWDLDSLCVPSLIFYLFWKAYEISNELMQFLLHWKQYIYIYILGEVHLGATDWAPDNWALCRFPILFYFSSYEEKTMNQAIP